MFAIRILTLSLILAMAASCTTATTSNSDISPPLVNSTVPANLAVGVVTSDPLTVQFSEVVNPATVTSATFALAQGATAVTGLVTATGSTATFTPSVALTAGLVYTASLTMGVKDLAGNALLSASTWSFTTGAAAKGPPAVALGTAGNYVILAQSAISTNPASAIVGDLGLSPAALSFITGFSHPDATGMPSTTSSQVTGTLYAADLASPTPALLTTAVGDMGTAYTDAAGRVSPDFLNAGTGEIGGLTLVPGLYQWTTGLNASTSATLDGGPNDVWIFQIAGNLVVGNAVQINLTGGALPKNIFWQVAGSSTMGTTSNFAGVLLCKTNVALQTGASMNGRIFAQTAVTLDQATVTQP